MYDKSIFIQKNSIDRFIYAVKNGMYIEAHELLEEDWKRYKSLWKKTQDEKYRLKAKAVQGLINGATALALFFIKKRPHSYKKIWEVFEKYRPLLDCVEFENKENYFEARDLLIKINKTIKLN